MKDDGKDNSSSKVVDAKVERHTTEAAGGLFAPVVQLFGIFDLIIKMHIVLAAFLFPTSWGKSDANDPGLAAFYRLWCLLFGCVLLLLHGLGIFALVTRTHLIDFAKVLFIAVAWSLTIIFTIVVNHEKTLGALLFAVEDEATHTRDESVMLIRAGQAGLRSLNKKVSGETAPDQLLTASELFKSIGPLALMFVNKERSLLKWGMAGANLASKGLRFAQHLLKKN